MHKDTKNIHELPYNLRKMISAMNNMRSSFVRINEAIWAMNNDNLVDYKYPFAKSFDELSVEVAEWIDYHNQKLYPVLSHYLLREPVLLQSLLEKAAKVGECQETSGEDIISFGWEGHTIINPFRDETSIYDVDPILYYGRAFLDSDFCKGPLLEDAIVKLETLNER